MPRLRRLEAPCGFGEEPGTCVPCVGRPAAGFGPLHFQLAWLRATRDGSIAPEALATLVEAPVRGTPTEPREGNSTTDRGRT